MAGQERRMVFDIRGRRKRVVQVVYAVLAALMALSLFTVVGPVNFGDLFGGGSSSSSTGALDDRVAQVERKLAKDPKDQNLLVQDVRARYAAGNAKIERGPNTGAPVSIATEGINDFRKAGSAWVRYMELNPKQATASAAQLAATSLLYTAATGVASDFSDSMKSAVQAQQVFAEARPSLNSYLTLAQYNFFAGDAQAGEVAVKKATQEASADQRTAVKQQADAYRKQGAQIQKQIKAQTKFQPGGGKQALENPLGGLSGGGGSGLGAGP